MTKMKLDFTNMETEWLGNKVPFHPRKYFRDNARLRDLLRNDPVRVEIAESFLDQSSGHYIDNIYEVNDTNEIASSLTHLTPSQRDDLRKVFNDRRELFSGRIGCYTKRKFHIDLKPGAKPYRCKHPYRIAQCDIPAYKKEMERQCSLGLCFRVYDTAWGMPGFVRPKKDGSVRTTDDMRELNSRIERTRYPLPTLKDIFERRRNYKFFTKIDISMQYYTFLLDEESSAMCVVVTPFGKYQRTRVPMGLKPAADWAQATMAEVFEGSDSADEHFFDDIGIFDTDWNNHLRKVADVLQRLEVNGFTVNPRKCAWAVLESEWLGHYLTPKAFAPDYSKVAPILLLAEPTTLKQLRHFIGFVNFYKEFWEHRAHIMAPLTALTGLSNSALRKRWGPREKQVFEKIKLMIASHVLLTYPDPNLPFDIEPDASDYQLGAVIKQLGKPIAFFSRKLTSSQRNYSTIEKELLSSVETLEEYRSLLKGAEIRIHTDHKNLTFKTLRSERVRNWRTSIEEFSPDFIYKPGKEQIVADFLSRHPKLEEAEIDERMFYEPLLNDWKNRAESVFDSFLNYPID
jgi:hypothetical protein